jgi:hypothetical protein
MCRRYRHLARRCWHLAFGFLVTVIGFRASFGSVLPAAVWATLFDLSGQVLLLHLVFDWFSYAF